jgi:hypothetical protein
MTLEKELLDFTNWLYNNNWKLIGDGMCLNTETKQIGSVKQLAMESASFGDYYPQDFQVGDKVRVKLISGDEVKLISVDYNKYDREYQYWYEDEEGSEWYGFGDEFEKID